MKWFIIGVLALSLNALGQTSFVKKDIVIPKFTFALAQFEEFKAWQGRTQYVVNIAKIDGELALAGEKNW